MLTHKFSKYSFYSSFFKEIRKILTGRKTNKQKNPQEKEDLSLEVFYKLPSVFLFKRAKPDISNKNVLVNKMRDDFKSMLD